MLSLSHFASEMPPLYSSLIVLYRNSYSKPSKWVWDLLWIEKIVPSRGICLSCPPSWTTCLCRLLSISKFKALYPVWINLWCFSIENLTPNGVLTRKMAHQEWRLRGISRFVQTQGWNFLSRVFYLNEPHWLTLFFGDMACSFFFLQQTNWEEVVDSFDNMNLKESLLRGIYAYGWVDSSVDSIEAEQSSLNGIRQASLSIHYFGRLQVWKTFSNSTEGNRTLL